MLKTLKNKSVYVVIFLFTFLLGLVLLRHCLIGEYTFLSKLQLSDLVRANLPTYTMIYDEFATGFNIWQWEMGIGTSIFTHADVLFDPFTYICFLGGRANIAEMMGWSLLIKLCAEAVTMGVFLKHFKLGDFSVFLGGILYAFCGYSLIMGSNLALGTSLVYFPLVLLGVEKMLTENKKGGLLFALFLVAIYYYYYFFIIGILSLVYLIARLWMMKASPKQWRNAVFSLAILGMISGLLSAFTILPQALLVFGGTRVKSKDVPFDVNLFLPNLEVLTTSLSRIFANDILGSKVNAQYYGYHNDYFQLTFFVSCTAVIFIVQYVLYHKEQRKKVFGIAIASLIGISFGLVAYLFNAFSTINYRWAFIYNFLLVFGMALGVDSVLKNGGFHTKRLIASIVVSLFVMGYSVLSRTQTTDIFKGHLSSNSEVFSVVIYIYLALIVLDMIYKLIKGKIGIKGFRISFSIVLLALLSLEIMANYRTWLSPDNLSKYGQEPQLNYEDGSMDVIANIQKKDQSFYRINKTFDSVVDGVTIPSCNDAMVQKYYGLKCYNSINNANYIYFLQSAGVYVCLPYSVSPYKEQNKTPFDITGQDLNFICGVYERYDLMCYLAVKYLISDRNMDSDLPPYFELKENSQGYFVYYNHAYCPLAFSNSGIISYSEYLKLNEELRGIALLKYTVLSDELMAEKHITSAQIDVDVSEDLENLVLQKQQNYSEISFAENHIEFEIDMAEDGYLSLGMPYDSNWQIVVDGKKVQTEKINCGLLGAVTTGGHHRVEVRYVGKDFIAGTAISVVTLIGLVSFGIWWQCRRRKESEGGVQDGNE